jgi:hypothetical protein
MSYTPDRWAVVKITNKEGKTHYRVFGTWYGGYLDGASWRLNSGINKVDDNEKYYLFHGNSGSEYACNKKSYGTSGYSAAVLHDLALRSKEAHGIVTDVMPEDTDWLTLNYGEVK